MMKHSGLLLFPQAFLRGTVRNALPSIQLRGTLGCSPWAVPEQRLAAMATNISLEGRRNAGVFYVKAVGTLWATTFLLSIKDTQHLPEKGSHTERAILMGFLDVVLFKNLFRLFIFCLSFVDSQQQDRHGVIMVNSQTSAFLFTGEVWLIWWVF